MSNEYRRYFADEGITGLEEFPEYEIFLCLTDAQHIDLDLEPIDGVATFDVFGIPMIIIALEYVGERRDRRVWRVTIRQAS